MSVQAATTLDAGQRETLYALGDVLIPASGEHALRERGRPQGQVARKGARGAPRPLADARRASRPGPRRGPGREARRLHEEEPDAFSALSQIVSGAYYMNLKVRKRIGYPGQGNRKPFEDEADYDLRDGLLDPVIDRGPIHKQPPPTPAPNGKVEPLSFNLSRNGERPNVLVDRRRRRGLRRVALPGRGRVQRRLPRAGPLAERRPSFPETSSSGSSSPTRNGARTRTRAANPPTTRSRSPNPRSRLSCTTRSAAPPSTSAPSGCACARRTSGCARVDGLADDWPISYEEMKPYYERIDQAMQISGMTGDPTYPAGPAPALPPLPIGPLGRKAAVGHERPRLALVAGRARDPLSRRGQPRRL